MLVTKTHTHTDKKHPCAHGLVKTQAGQNTSWSKRRLVKTHTHRHRHRQTQTESGQNERGTSGSSRGSLVGAGEAGAERPTTTVSTTASSDRQCRNRRDFPT
eukprot:2953164-Rhodomonas_salina.1